MKLLTTCNCREPDGWTPKLLAAWKAERGIEDPIDYRYMDEAMFGPLSGGHKIVWTITYSPP